VPADLGISAGKDRKEIVMTNSARLNDIRIDRVDSAAIRREIGDRLRIALNAERIQMTPSLLDLVDRTAAQDRTMRPKTALRSRA
jgi:hypothetical protein